MNYSQFINQQEVFKVSHMGEPSWPVKHHFQDSATDHDISEAEEDMGVTLCESLKAFWKLSNGALLYKNENDPLWGWRILGCHRYLEGQHKWRRKFFDEWRMQYMVIAELLSPLAAIVWDQYSEDVFYLDTNTRYMKPVKIAEDVSDFFEKLHHAQGGLFWEWP